MKFSILTLLAATGYVALVFAGLKAPESWWRYGSTLAWLAILAYMLILATDPLNRGKEVFGRVVVACIAAYIVLTWLPSTLTSARSKADFLPHSWFMAWRANIESNQVPASPMLGITLAQLDGHDDPFSDDPDDPFAAGGQMQSSGVSYARAVELVAALNFALVFGLMGGSVALWRFRRLERRAT